MIKKDQIFQNPLRNICQETEDILPEGGFGAVMARAGLGKTALLVQIALDNMLRDKKVLHISLNDPVKKVCLWYQEVFRNITAQHDSQAMNRLWDSILAHRLIMTFNVDIFSVPKLEERITDFTTQGIFQPQVLLIDGLPFDSGIRKSLEELRILAQNEKLRIWLAVRTHRHEPPGPDGLPLPFSPVADLFDVAFELKAEGKNIFIKGIKGAESGKENLSLILDTSTLLIKEVASGRVS